jgi:hypothetical protein
MGITDDLDKMIAEAQANPTVAGTVSDTLVPPAPDTTPILDPLAHLIGGTDPNVDRDPFTLELDALLAQEGLSKETETQPKTEGYEAHEWEFKETLIYEDDVVEAVCKKCFRQMRMNRAHTWAEAMEHHKVNPDCGMGVTAEVMDS